MFLIKFDLQQCSVDLDSPQLIFAGLSRSVLSHAKSNDWLISVIKTRREVTTVAGIFTIF